MAESDATSAISAPSALALSVASNDSTAVPEARQRSPRRRVPCDHCDYIAMTKQALQWHLCIHTGERPLKCSYKGCNAASASPSNLAKHQRTCGGLDCDNVDGPEVLATSERCQPCHDQRQRDRGRHLYIIVCSVAPRLLKIGRSSDPSKRAVDLQSGQCFWMSLREIIHDAGPREHAVHRALKHRRV